MSGAAHPAKFTDTVLDNFEALCHVYHPNLILDPFAGTGRVHSLPGFTVGVEIEPEWAEMDRRTIQGNALALPFAEKTFDAVITSPTYGNRMADHHLATEKCKACNGTGLVAWTGNGPIGVRGLMKCPKCDGRGRREYRRLTYRHMLGRELHPMNSGQLQWGWKYQGFHEQAWREAQRVLKTDGLLMINVSNHIRSGREVDVVGWHRAACVTLGFVLLDKVEVDTPRMRFGANRDLRIDHEVILVLQNRRLH